MGKEYILKAEPGHFGLRNSLQPDVKLRCGGCGQTDFFRVVVRPTDNIARVVGMVCARCNVGLPVGENGYIMGMGQLDHHFNTDIRKMNKN